MAKRKKQDISEEAGMDDYMESASKLREDLFADRKEKKKQLDPKQEFKKMFIKLKNKHNLKPELESVIWAHLKSIKCEDPDKFLDGIKNFGIKI